MKYYVLTISSSPKGESGESCGSEYDLQDACKNCGTGAQLSGDLYTKKLKFVKNNFFSTLDGDFLISREIHSLLIENDIILRDTSGVVDSNGNPLPLYHLKPKFAFPKLLSESQGLRTDNQCPICKKDGYFNEVVVGDLTKGITTYVKPLTFHFEKIDEGILMQSDIFHTWEHIGVSNLVEDGNKVVRYARPLLIVSEKFKKTLEMLCVRNVLFSEVIIHMHSGESQ